MTRGARAIDRVVRVVPRSCAGFAVAAGVLALVGGFTGVRPLTGGFGNLPSMVATTAVMSVLAGIALWGLAREPIAPRWRRIASSCAVGVCAISGATALEYVASVDVGIGRLLRHGGRPSPQTAVAFLLIGCALLVLDRSTRARRLADYVAISALVVAIAALLGYLLGVPAMYGVPAHLPDRGMSLLTALVVCGLAFGILVARTQHGIVAIVLARDAGGAVARRLLAGLLVIPLVALAVLAGAHAELYTFPFAAVLVALFAFAEAGGLIVSTAQRLGRADLALQASESRVRALVEQAADAIFVADLDGRYIEVNDAACRMLGYARGELLGKTIMDLIPAEDVPRLAATKTELLGGAGQVAAWTLRRRDGSYVPVEISAKILDDGRWQAIVRDISERRRSEAALEASYASEVRMRAWLQTIIDQLPEGVIVVDTEGRPSAMNRAARALATPGALLDVRDLEHRPLADDELPGIRALRTGEVIHCELVVRRSDGTMVPIDASAGPIRDDRAQITGAVVVVTDATERKESERTREEWVAVVAHDLRQPLNTILLSTDRAKALAADERQAAVIGRIRGAAWRLNRMIEDLLDAARITAHQLAIDPRITDVVELARNAIDNARLASPDVELQLVAGERELAWIDAERIDQVLGNLISNAVKYGAPGAPISVEVTGRDTQVEIAVRNTGTTIPPDELSRLFARFSRTDQARTSRIPGIGLGLYICKGLVEAHGGQIWAESDTGATRFAFTVPRPATG